MFWLFKTDNAGEHFMTYKDNSYSFPRNTYAWGWERKTLFVLASDFSEADIKLKCEVTDYMEQLDGTRSADAVYLYWCIFVDSGIEEFYHVHQQTSVN